MSARFIASAALALTLLGLVARSAQGAETARAVIVEPRPVDLPGVGPRALRGAVADGLSEAGIDVVPPNEMDPAQLTCADASCRRELAKATHATDIVEVDATATSRDDFDLKLHVFDPATGEEIGAESLLCNVCLAKELLTRAKDMAGVAWGRAAKTRALHARAGQSATGTPPPVSPVPSGPAEAERPVWQRALPIAGIAAGAGLAGWGVYLLAGNGKEACDYQPCALVHDDKRRGGLLIGAGGLLAAVGIGALVYQAHDTSTTVGIGPGSLFLAGRF